MQYVKNKRRIKIMQIVNVNPSYPMLEMTLNDFTNRMANVEPHSGK